MIDVDLIVQKLKKERYEKRITQEQVAKFLSMSTINYRKIESSSKSPRLTLENYMLICDFLNIPYEKYMRSTQSEKIISFNLSESESECLKKIIEKILK